MIKDEIKFKGKKFEFVYPEGLEKEIKTQVSEIFKREQYKNGIRKDGVYLDLGANVGNTTRYFAPYAKKIYSVEPNPVIYEALVENTKNLKNVETFNFAIGSFAGIDYMFSNKGGSLPQTFYGDDTSAHGIKVNVKPIGDFVKENDIKHIDTMKIDVEGAEYIIFASDSFCEIADRIDYIIGESHFTSGFPEVLGSMLKDAGFDNFRFLEGVLPNCSRQLDYTNPLTGAYKKWSIKFNTMFEAYR